MTPERAKELLPIIEAFANGKVVECREPPRSRNSDREWGPVARPSWADDLEYRIAPTIIKYRRYIYAHTSTNGIKEHRIANLHETQKTMPPEQCESMPSFVAWIDDDWITQEA